MARSLLVFHHASVDAIGEAAMSRKLIGACVGLAMMGMAGTASAVVITFDDLSGGDCAGKTSPVSSGGFSFALGSGLITSSRR